MYLEENSFWGETPEPSVEDGWRVVGRVEATPDGLTIREVSIEPHPLVWEEAAGRARKRTPEECEGLDINHSVLKLVDPTAIKRAFEKFDLELARRTANPERQRRFKARAARAGMTPAKREKRAKWAEHVLEEARAGRGFRARLAKRWRVGEEAVKKRLRVLRYEGWILGDSAAVLPGPMYTEWLNDRQEQTGAMEAEDGER